MKFMVWAAGDDRPGMVAGLSRALAHSGASLSDCSMTRLANQFGMMILVDYEGDSPEAVLEPLKNELGLQISVREITSVDNVASDNSVSDDTYMVSVYGVDRTGIVADVTGFLAERGVNIVDLETRVLGAEQNVYTMLMETKFPPGADAESIGSELASFGNSVGVEITIHLVEADIL